MITLRDNFSLAVSATAPFYSLIVTVPLMYRLVGVMTPMIYLLSVIPILFTHYSMKHNNYHHADNGAVYSWTQSSKTISWIAGFSVVATDIVSTSSQAVVAGEYGLKLVGDIGTPVAISIVSCVLVILIALININSLKKTSVLQFLGIIIQIMAMIYVVYLVFTTDSSVNMNIEDAHHSITDYAHALLLGVFAYWGFDVVYFVSEDSDSSTAKASLISILTLTVFFVSASWVMISQGFHIEHNFFIMFTVFISAFMSLGSAIIPTANSMVAMAKNNEFPSSVSTRKAAVVVVVVIVSLWTIVSVFSLEFFEATVDCLGVFVGIYFSISLYTAYKNYRGNRFVNASGLVLMLSITVISLWEIIDDANSGFFSSLAFPAAIVLLVGVVFYYFYFYKKSLETLE